MYSITSSGNWFTEKNGYGRPQPSNGVQKPRFNKGWSSHCAQMKEYPHYLPRRIKNGEKMTASDNVTPRRGQNRPNPTKLRLGYKKSIEL